MKGLGYLISTVSVVLLGIVSWKSGQPLWKSIVLVLGMGTSVCGMFFRYLSHRKEQKAIAYAQREAERQG